MKGDIPVNCQLGVCTLWNVWCPEHGLTVKQHYHVTCLCVYEENDAEIGI